MGGGDMPDEEPNFLGLFKGERNPVALKAGEVLFNKGDPARCMYVVLSGELRIGDGNIVLENVSAGGIVGEMALIDHSPRSATVTAIAATTLAEVDEKRFLFMVRETPSFALNVLRLLTGRLRRTLPRIGA
jgi:CRP/FNR family transcriptional regulator, cyclic AMP receptor protein